jgi:protein-S-isoprenylcysteine O-methyltransferase Ste14
MRLNRSMQIFLLGVCPLLALALAYLGWKTLPGNLLGWFLLVIGVGYPAGGAIYLWVKSKSRAGLLAPVFGQEAIREEPGDRSFWLVLPGFLAVFFGSPVEFLLLPALLPRGTGMQIAGLIVIGLGGILHHWTRRFMGDLFTGRVQVQAGHRLVQGGPYRFIRHPAYASYLLITLGLALGYSSLIGLAALPILLLPGLVYRLKVEEELLSREFGEDYRRYRQKTKRLVPGIW